MNQELLLVEDDAELLRLAAAEAGISHPIRWARNGEEALELLLKQRLTPVATLLDLKMPGIGGLETLRRLRADRIMRSAVVFVLTSSDLEGDKLEAKRLGCNLYFTKPSSFDGYRELARLLKTLLPATDLAGG